MLLVAGRSPGSSLSSDCGIVVNEAAVVKSISGLRLGLVGLPEAPWMGDRSGWIKIPVACCEDVGGFWLPERRLLDSPRGLRQRLQGLSKRRFAALSTNDTLVWEGRLSFHRP